MPRKVAQTTTRAVGRPRKDGSPAGSNLLANGKPATGPRKYRNITVDTEILDLLNATINEMEKILGFRPTQSQAIRAILKSYKPK